MRKLALLLLFVPAIALANKSYNMESNVTHDCAKEPDVSINVSGATFELTGRCDDISINGSENKVVVDSVDRITINGADNIVGVTAANRISVNGADNKVTYKKGIKKAKPKVKVRGAGSKVTRAK